MIIVRFGYIVNESVVFIETGLF